MATLLTTSYKKIGTISLTYDEVRIYAKYTSQNTSTNKTSYSLKTTYYRAEGSLSADSSTSKLDGTSKSFGYTTFKKGETTLQEVTRTITHNNDGSSPTKSVTASMSMSYGGSGSKTVEITFPKINRLATVTKASDFNDEKNPTLEFSNPAGFTVYPYLNFYDNENNLVYQLIRNSESATSPYAWDITDEERTALWKATNKQQSYKVSVGVDTYNGTTKLGYNSKSQTMTYVNAKPTYTYTIVDENTKVTDLLGESAEYLVQNVSQPKITINPTAKKEATISNVALSYNGVGSILQSEPYEKSYIANSTDFLVKVYDSRLFYVGQDTITRNIIEYLTVNIDSFSFKRENPTSSNIILNAQIRYKQAIFGSTDNVPTIKWKLGAEGELNTLTTEDYTIDEENNKIIISNLVLENVLDYKNPGEFYLYANDLLTEDKENAYPVPKGIPTFDAGEHDFKVNGELYVADENGQNKVDILDSIKKLEIMQNVMTIGLSNDTSYTASANYATNTLNLTVETGKSGTLLSQSNNGIKIGKGISKVVTTANIIAQSSTSSYGIRIAKNGTYVAESFTNPDGSSAFHAITVPPIVIDVTEGDVITLLLYINDSGATKKIKAYSGRGTYLTVMAIQ